MTEKTIKRSEFLLREATFYSSRSRRIPAFYGADDLIPDQTYTDNGSGRCVAALEKVGIPDSQAPPNAQTHGISPRLARKTRPNPRDSFGLQSQSLRSGRFSPSDCAGSLDHPYTPRPSTSP